MRLNDLHGKRVAILGAGREGRAAWRAIRACHPSLPLTFVDERQPAPDERIDADSATSTIVGPLADAPLTSFDVLIRSPGISPYRPELRDIVSAGAGGRGVRMTTPTSIFFGELSRSDARVVCITGTKGKSTTSTLLHRILLGAGVRAALRGNIGAPMLDEPGAEDDKVDVYVLEMSSAQIGDLDTPGGLPPGTVGVLLNLFPAHLDYHGDVEAYYADKVRLFELISDGTRLVCAQQEEAVVRTRAHDVVRFACEDGIHVRDGWFMDGAEEMFHVEPLALRGAHNLVNCCAALAAAKALGVDPRAGEAALRAFEPLAHRLQVVARTGEDVRSSVVFVNDSISTTPQAAAAALRAYADAPVALLVGGKDVGVVWDELIGAVLERGHPCSLVTLADNGPAIADLVRVEAARRGCELPEIVHATEFESGIEAAYGLVCEVGGVVLLSPGAPSQPVFRDFMERGDRFAGAARGIAGCEREGGVRCGR